MTGYKPHTRNSVGVGSMILDRRSPEYQEHVRRTLRLGTPKDRVLVLLLLQMEHFISADALSMTLRFCGCILMRNQDTA